MSRNFKIESNRMVLSDPCYEHPKNGGTWCQGIANVVNGIWEADIEKVEGRISKLYAYNLNAAIDDPTIKSRIEKFGGTPLPITAGVDSGQFGFFDYDMYRNDEIAKDLPKKDFGDDWDESEGDSWYRVCCKLILSDESWGTIPFGVVSASGYGDGSYQVTGIKNSNSEYVALSVIFIIDIGDDDFYDDEEDEEI
jgi:hypothetical protein